MIVHVLNVHGGSYEQTEKDIHSCHGGYHAQQLQFH